MRKKAFQALVLSMLCMIEAHVANTETYALICIMLSVTCGLWFILYYFKIDKYFKRKSKQVTN